MGTVLRRMLHVRHIVPLVYFMSRLLRRSRNQHGSSSKFRTLLPWQLGMDLLESVSRLETLSFAQHHKHLPNQPHKDGPGVSLLLAFSTKPFV